jgi:tripartite ATP-independent transporter DctM subunit
MDPGLLTIIMFVAFFGLLALGVPLAWVTSAIGLAIAISFWGIDASQMIVLRMWDTMGSFGLIAVPLFVFMGNMLERSGIAHELFEALHIWMGRLRGGVSAATVTLCTILAAMIGTVGADVTISGLIAYPFMIKRKYNKHLALGCVMAGGSLGVMIPPSIMFVIYGQTVGESIGKLLIGGIGPGLVLSGLFVIYILVKCYLKPEMGPAASEAERRMPFVQKVGRLKSLVLPIFLIGGVMGSIFVGLATPGEAAGIGALGALVCAAIRGRLNWKNLKDTLFSTMRTMGIIMWIVFGAMIFVAAYSMGGGAEFMKQMLLALPFGRWGILFVIQIIILFLGMVLDVIGITVLTAPIFVPVIKALGFDPLWFGIIFAMNLQIAYLSPPFGYSMFYMKAVTPPDVSMTDLYRSVVPFIALQLVGMAVVMTFPEIALWLPTQMIGQ